MIASDANQGHVALMNVAGGEKISIQLLGARHLLVGVPIFIPDMSEVVVVGLF